MDELSDQVFTINEGKLERLENTHTKSQVKVHFKVYVRKDDKMTGKNAQRRKSTSSRHSKGSLRYPNARQRKLHGRPCVQ